MISLLLISVIVGILSVFFYHLSIEIVNQPRIIFIPCILKCSYLHPFQFCINIFSFFLFMIVLLFHFKALNFGPLFKRKIMPF